MPISSSFRARAVARLAAAVTAVAATALAVLPAAADRHGPGYAIPDSDGHAAASHLGGDGPPGTAVYGAHQVYCADPERKGPDAAGGYAKPVTVDAWTSSVTGKPVPAAHLARASYLIDRYGQTHADVPAAAVDAAVYHLLAGGPYALDGARGKQWLSAPGVPARVRTTARAYLAEAERHAGPHRLTLTPQTERTPAGRRVTVTATVTAGSGAPVPDVTVTLTETGPGGERGRVTTGPDGTARIRLTVHDRDGTVYRAVETRAPAGYRADAPSQRFTVTPGARTTLTFADTKIPTPTQSTPTPTTGPPPRRGPPPRTPSSPTPAPAPPPG